MMMMMATLPSAVQWRASKAFIIACVTVALFADTFLYGFIVPILGYILEDRLQIDGSHTQSLTSAILAVHGIIGIAVAPIIGHFADQSSSRKTPLLLSLSGCVVGTVLVACASSLWMLFLGRTLQGIACSAVWIVSIATIADTVDEKHMGATMGVVNSFATGGVVAGPAVSGLLLPLVGYWGTWAAPVVILALDIIARSIMVENPRQTPPSPGSSTAAIEGQESDETRPLLAHTTASNEGPYQSTKGAQSYQPHDQSNLSTTSAFYRMMFTNPRVVTALLISISTGCIMTTFDATLPLHVREVFGWGPSPTGMMFVCLEVPAILGGPLCGWLRDRLGSRIPAALSLAALAPVFWLLGVPGNDHFPWAGANAAGIPIFIACMLAIGTLAPFLSGLTMLELTAVVKQYTERNPNIFGPNGGYARAYSIADVAGAVAMTLGPTVSGALRQTVGYYYMNLIFAIVVGGLSFLSYWCLGDKHVERDDLCIATDS